MRKLVYSVNGIETTSYKEAQEAKEKGFKVEEKLYTIREENTGRKLIEKIIADRKKNAAALAE